MLFCKREIQDYHYTQDYTVYAESFKVVLFNIRHQKLNREYRYNKWNDATHR